MGKTIFILSVFAVLFVSCGGNSAKEKELELGERELALKEKELEVKPKENKASITKENQENNEGKIKEASENKDIVWTNSTDGVFTDPRDNRKYNIVKIGKQIWMAENLVFKSSKDFYPIQGSTYGYDENYMTCDGCGSLNNGTTYNKITGEEYHDIYGGLYTWESAKASCPPGWHLPSKAEWTELIDFHGGKKSSRELCVGIGSFSNWGDWNKLSKNKFGFGAIPGGRLELDSNFLNYVAGFAFYWTSTNSSNSQAYTMIFNHFSNTIKISKKTKTTYALSVRCIKD